MPLLEDLRRVPTAFVLAMIRPRMHILSKALIRTWGRGVGAGRRQVNSCTTSLPWGLRHAVQGCGSRGHAPWAGFDALPKLS
jgi:hypothetical protein